MLDIRKMNAATDSLWQSLNVRSVRQIFFGLHLIQNKFVLPIALYTKIVYINFNRYFPGTPNGKGGIL